MRQLSIVAALVVAVFSAACGDNGNNNPADGRPRPDARDVDAPATPDAMVDADPDDPDAAFDASTIDASGNTTSAQIAAARATPDGSGLSLPITDATITYIKPQIGNPTNDPAGFTIQAEQAGPALFIAVDPATLTPTPAVGDVVSFTITDMGTAGGGRKAVGVSGYSRTSTGANVGALAQNISGNADLVSMIDSYESELIDVSGTIAGDFASSGTGFQRAPINTAGLAGDINYVLRVPTTLRDALDIVNGCAFTLDNTPVGRFNAQTQLAAFSGSELTLTGCPAPTVVSAVALSGTSVRVTFDRNILASSVTANGSQFTFDNGLTASAASVSGRDVTVTTNAQAGGTTYTVTVAATVTDLSGTAVGTPNTATFSGFLTPAVVRINEVNANITIGTCDLIELRVVSGGSMASYELRERNNQTLITFAAGFTVATNDIIVVHMNAPSATCNPSGHTQETTSTTQQAGGGNYATAFDWWSADTGLTNTDNVFTLYDHTATIIDAVFVTDDAAGTAAGDTETQAAAVAAVTQWEMVGGGIPPGGFVDDNFNMHAVLDLNDPTSDTALGTSIQRSNNNDTNNVNGWTSTNLLNTWGLINAGQTPF